MDDVYQFTNEAVQSNQGTQQQKQSQEDVILNAFNNFGFSQRWSNLVDTVKKQSEQVVNVTRNDLQEFAQVLKEDTNQTVDKISKSVKPDIKGKGRAKNKEEEEEEGIWSYVWYQTQQLPSALRLPDNMDLGKLRQEMDQGTRYAEHYLQTFGSEVMDTVNKALDMIDSDNDDDQQQQEVREPEGRQSTSSNRTKRIFATRKERLLAEMRTDPNTFLTQLPDTDTNEFDVEKKTDEIAHILDEFPDLREMMDNLVPIKVTYILFWQRYFYHAEKIEKEDEKRQLIAEGADEEDEFKWDSDDEDEVVSSTQQKEEQTNKKKSIEEKKVVENQQDSKEQHQQQQVKKDDKKPQEDITNSSNKNNNKNDSDDSDSDWE
ncbi:hypothetical protein INT45_001832 [Circinella minor]|uniref:BSD domain-containing protein n=1 Tax=Circinella minor TaxID=1195481 RepID=A0A8H7RT00_9FUNG|nr:hypothetical protein INT45_001832 [Circinella minor]